MHYLRQLLFLSTFLSLLMCASCITDYANTMDVQYDNETDSTIRFAIDGESNLVNELVLPPGTSSQVLTFVRMGPKEIDPEMCCSHWISSLFESQFGVYIYINDTSCMYQREGLVDVSNYAYQQQDKRHVKFTYTITGDDFKEALSCDE